MTAQTTATVPADPFAAPAEPTTGEWANWADLKGDLLLFYVKGYVEHSPTSKTKPGQKSPMVETDMVVLDGALAGKEYPGQQVRGVLMHTQLKDRVGQKVLGRLAQGESRNGNNAPWLLTAPTEDDKARGRNYLAQLEAKKAANTDPFAI
jgi:hypothetical protein